MTVLIVAVTTFHNAGLPVLTLQDAQALIEQVMRSYPISKFRVWLSISRLRLRHSKDIVGPQIVFLEHIARPSRISLVSSGCFWQNKDSA